MNAKMELPLVVLLKFDKALSRERFERVIELLFKDKNEFHLLGSPIRLGPRKVHVYGVYRWLWQAISFEVTRRHILAIVPGRTCRSRDTIHDLVRNVRKYLDPQIEAWVGEQRYDVWRKESRNEESE